MREQIPHDYLVLWGIAALVAGLLFPVSLIAGWAAVCIWIFGAIFLFARYR